MKLVILTGWYPNQVVVEDGLSVRNQAKALWDSGINVSVVSISMMRQYASKGIFFPKIRKTFYEELPQYSIEGFHPSRNGRLLFEHYNRLVFHPFNRYIEEKGLPDLIHVHNYTTGLAALWLKQKYNIPYIITEHSTSFMDDWVPLSHRSYIEEIFQGAEDVFGVSTALAKAMEQYAGQEVKVLPNFIDTDLFTPTDASKKIHQAPRLITVSTLNKRKQVDILIESMPVILDKLPGTTLHIVGYGEEERSLKRLVSKLDLEQHIFFEGPASQLEVAEHLQNSALYVSASRTETFGVVYVEALACGLPVVALDSGGVRDMVEHGVNGYIVNEEKKIAKYILKALSVYASFDRKQIVENCRRGFGIPSNVERHKNLYAQIRARYSSDTATKKDV